VVFVVAERGERVGSKGKPFPKRYLPGVWVSFGEPYTTALARTNASRNGLAPCSIGRPTELNAAHARERSGPRGPRNVDALDVEARARAYSRARSRARPGDAAYTPL
jgi:hypothetical protein